MNKSKVNNDIRLVCEHYAMIDEGIAWYGSMKFLPRTKADDNLIRVKSKDVAQELLEISFG